MFCCFLQDANQKEYLPLKDTIQKGKNVPKNIASVDILDINGQKVTFESVYQKKTVLVSFLRHFGCVLCIEQAHEIISRRNEFQEK